ncbi:hypothetical protein ACLKA7_001698 [Drosophila subpalustris]
MPQSERPSSPEEQNSNSNSNSNSDHYNMHRLEHDLYELFEEQQMLLDIVSQQQERQLELQRLPTTEPPPRAATPLPELLLEEIGDEVPEVVDLPELEARPEAELLGTVEEEEHHLEEKTALLPPRRCICAQLRRQPKHQVIQSRTRTGGQCSPPKLTGLGYDSPFPYPKHLSKGRNRRALYIFSVVNNLVLRMQQFMTLTNNNNICFPLPPCPSVVITELPKEAATFTSTSASASTKLKPTPTTTLGALPKPTLKTFEHTVKASTKLKATTTKRLRKRPRTTTPMEQEIDMDCEFGMDHIQKFRLDRVREDSINKRSHLSGQSSLVSNQMDEDDLSAAMNGLMIFDDAEPQSKQLQTDWPCPESQLETRPCTPELQHPEELNSTHSLLPAVLESNGFIDLMPSTSAQARALALTIHSHGSSSVTSDASPLSSQPYPEYSPLNTPPKSPQIQQQQQQTPTAEALQCQRQKDTDRSQKTEEGEDENRKRNLSNTETQRQRRKNESDIEMAMNLVRNAARQRIRIRSLDPPDQRSKCLPKWIRADITVAQTNCSTNEQNIHLNQENGP